MKKIYSILAIAAVVLGMASCNNNETNLNRFKITVDNIKATTAHVTITPPNDQMYYTKLMLNEATFKWYQAQEAGLAEALKWFDAGQGAYEDVWDVYPNTKFVICVAEKDEQASQTIQGEVEYKGFKTPSMEFELPNFVEDGQEYLEMEGEYYTVAKNIISLLVECPVPDAPNQKLQMYLYFVSDKFTGHFTTDDLFSFIFVTPFISLKDPSGENLESYPICGADLKGEMDEATRKCTYTGSVDFYAQGNGLYRLPVKFQCIEWVDNREE